MISIYVAMLRDADTHLYYLQLLFVLFIFQISEDAESLKESEQQQRHSSATPITSFSISQPLNLHTINNVQNLTNVFLSISFTTATTDAQFMRICNGVILGGKKKKNTL